MSTATCPSHEELNAFSIGLLSDEVSDAIAAHLASCTDCRAGLSTLDGAEDTFLTRLRRPAVADPYIEESQCQVAVARAFALSATPPEGRSRSSFHTKSLGEYQLIGELGRGGMGTVYKALHTKLDRVVALKVLSRGRVEDPQAISRFAREMRAVGKISHPNVVQAHDAREIDGMPVLVMEFVDGLDLAEIVRRIGAAPIADACELVRRTALGLQCAHERGLVHRDIKPSNIMLTPLGEVKLMDLGLARFYAEDGSGVSLVADGEEMTGTGQAMGTADYMAPEQASDSRSVDIRADIYSLGCTLYKLLSGRAPFSGAAYRSTLDKLHAHVHQPIPPIRDIVPEVPEELAAILDRMLAKDPAARFDTPADVAAALDPLCKEANLVGLIERAMASGGDSLSLGESREDNRHPPGELAAASPPRRRILRRILIGLGFLGALGAAFAAGVVITINRDGKKTTVELEDGSKARVTADGLEVTLPGQANPVEQAPIHANSAPAAAPPATAPPEVAVVRPIVWKVADHEEFTGQTEAAQTAEVRSRVSGHLARALFKPGATVKQGDLLFELDPAAFQAEQDKREAEVRIAQLRLDRATAVVTDAKARARAKPNERWPWLEEQQSLKAEAEAALAAAEQGLKVARLNLASTRLTAPLSGRIGRPLVTAGSLVTDAMPLAVIDSVDPVGVVFDIDERTFLKLRRNPPRSYGESGLAVFVGLSDESHFSHKATFQSADTRINPATGTARYRALLPNPDGLLAPGMFVRVRLATSDPHCVLLVPERAFGSDQGQKYVFIVTDQNVVQRRNVQTGQLVDDGMRAVEKGLNAGDWVATSQLQLLRLGTTVKPLKPPTPSPSPSNVEPPAKGSAELSLYGGKTFKQWRDLARTDLDNETRVKAFQALGVFARSGNFDEAVPAILEAMKVDQPLIVLSAAYSALRTNPQGEAAIVSGIRHKDPGHRKAAIEALQYSSCAADAYAVPALIEALGDSDSRSGMVVIQDLAAIAIATEYEIKEDGKHVRLRPNGDVGPTTNLVVPALSKVLKDTDPNIRRVAVESLRRMGPLAKASIPDLITFVDAAFSRVKASRSSLRPWDDTLELIRGIEALRAMGPAASAAVPLLTSIQQTKNAELDNSEAKRVVREALDVIQGTSKRKFKPDSTHPEATKPSDPNSGGSRPVGATTVPAKTRLPPAGVAGARQPTDKTAILTALKRRQAYFRSGDVSWSEIRTKTFYPRLGKNLEAEFHVHNDEVHVDGMRFVFDGENKMRFETATNDFGMDGPGQPWQRYISTFNGRENRFYSPPGTPLIGHAEGSVSRGQHYTDLHIQHGAAA